MNKALGHIKKPVFWKKTRSYNDLYKREVLGVTRTPSNLVIKYSFLSSMSSQDKSYSPLGHGGGRLYFVPLGRPNVELFFLNKQLYKLSVPHQLRPELSGLVCMLPKPRVLVQLTLFTFLFRMLKMKFFTR